MMTSSDIAQLKKAYTEIIEPCREIKSKIVKDMEDFLNEEKYIDIIYGRVKSKESFLKKVLSNEKKYTPPFQQIEDFIAIRVLVMFRDVASDVALKIRNGFHPNVENYYKEPKNINEFGYEGHQIIQSIPLEYLRYLNTLRDKPTVFEIQVKTLYMHAWAEPEHLFEYKNEYNKSISLEMKKKLAWLAATSWGADSVMLDLKEENEKGDTTV